MEFSSSAYLEAVCGISFLNEKSDVYFKFLHESFPDMSGSYVLADLSCEGALVYHEVHAERGLFDMDHLHGLRMLRITDGLSDGNIRNAGYYYDVSAFCLRNRHTLESAVNEDLVDLSGDYFPVFFADSDLLAFSDDTAGDTSYTKTADVIVISQSGYLELQRFVIQIRIRLAMLDYCLEQRCQIQPAVSLRALLDLLSAFLDGHSKDILRISYSDTLAGNTVEDGKIQLIVVGFQIHEKFINLVDYFIDPCILLVKLVDEKNGIQPLFKGLLEYESGLRHGAFG